MLIDQSPPPTSDSDDGSKRKAKSGPISLLHFRELPNVTTSWLVKDLLPDHSLSLIWGDRSVGKSFISLDIALCLASGTAWLGHEVKQIPVAYLLNEGVRRFRRRIQGWLWHREIRERQIEEFLVHISPVEIGRTDREAKDIDRLIQANSAYVKRTEKPIGLFVIDTYGLAMTGDENSNSDTNANCRQLLRLMDQTGASVMLVHHAAKEKQDRSGKKWAPGSARGASALEGAMDTIWHVRNKGSGKNNVVSFHMTKQRDDEVLGMDLRFKPIDRDGQKYGKFPELVRESREEDPEEANLWAKQVERIFTLIKQNSNKSHGEIRRLAGFEENDKSRVSKMIEALRKAGRIKEERRGRTKLLSVVDGM